MSFLFRNKGPSVINAGKLCLSRSNKIAPCFFFIFQRSRHGIRLDDNPIRWGVDEKRAKLKPKQINKLFHRKATIRRPSSDCVCRRVESHANLVESIDWFLGSQCFCCTDSVMIVWWMHTHAHTHTHIWISVHLLSLSQLIRRRLTAVRPCFFSLCSAVVKARRRRAAWQMLVCLSFGHLFNVSKAGSGKTHTKATATRTHTPNGGWKRSRKWWKKYEDRRQEEEVHSRVLSNAWTVVRSHRWSMR